MDKGKRMAQDQVTQPQVPQPMHVDGSLPKPSESSQPPTADSQETTCAGSSQPLPKRRKPMKKRAAIWNHFTESKHLVTGITLETCNYCGHVYNADSKNCGTTSMKKHLPKCDKYECSEVNRPDLKQSELSLQAASSDQTIIEL